MPPEPVASSARPVVDMRTTTDHATHDLERLSAAVDGTLPAADRPSVDAQLAACAACADLHADLLALVAANRALPTPARPRDYQLTAADARRLQRGGIRGWLDRIGSPKDRLSRPLAVGLTTLGLVGRAGRDRPVAAAVVRQPAGPARAASAAASAPSQELVGKTADGQASAAPSAAAAPAAAAPAPSAAASAAAAVDATGSRSASRRRWRAPSGRLQAEAAARRATERRAAAARPGRRPSRSSRRRPPGARHVRDADSSASTRRRALARPRPVGRGRCSPGSRLFVLRFGARRRRG